MPKILVVADEPSIREVIRRFLTTEGYEVIEAGDGGAALEIALKEPPDLVLLDVMMPVMDFGLGQATRIRKKVGEDTCSGGRGKKGVALTSVYPLSGWPVDHHTQSTLNLLRYEAC